MKQGGICGFGMLVMGLFLSAAHAQVPAVPAAPAVPGVAGVAQNQTIWSKLIPSKEKCEQLRQDFCDHPMGQMFNTMMTPFTAFSGGLISPCCPPDEPNPDDLLKSSEDPAGAAAKIKADEAGAKERRANMRYLGTVDCHYWPEAEAALIVGLRTDKNECVRWEAALSLGRGCCCTRKTIEALRIVVIASEKDGNPFEKSDRVRAAALRALNHCLCCYRELPKLEPKERPPTTASKSTPALLPEYFAKLTPAADERLLSEAREAVARMAQPPGANALIQTGHRTVAHIVNRAAPASPPAPDVAALGGAGPVRPVAQTGGTAPAAAPRPAPPKGDLLQMFKNSIGGGEPPVAAVPQPPAPVPAARPLTPPTGSRDLLHIFRNSLN